MRLLPALLLVAAPLLAQEPSEKERRAEEERKAAEEARRADVDRAARTQYERLVEQLRSQATRKEAMEALKEANLSLDELLPLIAEAMERAERARTKLDMESVRLRKAAENFRTLYLGTETISGSADGTDYTLKSLGDGKYELSATKRAEDGRLMEKVADQGTLKELQEKYAFLRGGLAFQVPAPTAQPLRAQWVDLGGLWTGTEVRYDNGHRVATWSGGERVGVSVTPPPEELRFHLQLPEGAGFIVQQVVPGSRAEEIGIRRMDVLLKLDGELIDSPIQLKKLHEKTGVLEIIRRAEAKRIDLAQVKPAETAREKPADAPAPEGPR